MIYTITTSVKEQDHAILRKLLRKFKSEGKEVIELDKYASEEEIIQRLLNTQNFSFFQKQYVIVIDFKLNQRYQDLLIDIAKNTDLVLVDKAIDKTFLKKLAKLTKIKEFKTKTTYRDVIVELENIFPEIKNNQDFKEQLLSIVQVTGDDNRRYYSPYRISLIKKWSSLLKQNDYTFFKRYVVTNLDENADFWEQLKFLYSRDKKQSFEYFSKLLARVDLYEFINVLRSQLLTLGWVKFLQESGLNCAGIAKALQKNNYFIQKLCDLRVKSNKVLATLRRLFTLECKVRAGEVGDMQEGFLLILLTE